MNVALPLSIDYKRLTIVGGLTISLVVVILFSLTVGAVKIPVSDVVVILLKHIGFFSSTEVDSIFETVLLTIRIPRILMTVVIGAALAVSGASLQGLFRNPLVEPSLIGVSSGATMVVVLLIVFGNGLAALVAGWIYNSLTSFAAFIGGLLATLLVMRLANQLGKTNIAMLILTGVAVNAFSFAIVGLAIFYADENQLRTLTFWTLGDLGGASWDKLVIAIPLLLMSCAMLLRYRHALNALSIGETEAFHMGVDVERVKRGMILFSALAVGVSVSLAGTVGFIGLVVPHLIRVVFSPDNRLVLPASLLGGGLLLLIADQIARVVVAPSELPIGVMTALIGAPFFVMLLLNAKRKNEL